MAEAKRAADAATQQSKTALDALVMTRESHVPLSFPTYAGIIGRAACRASVQRDRATDWRAHQPEP